MSFLFFFFILLSQEMMLGNPSSGEAPSLALARPLLTRRVPSLGSQISTEATDRSGVSCFTYTNLDRSQMCVYTPPLIAYNSSRRDEHFQSIPLSSP